MPMKWISSDQFYMNATVFSKCRAVFICSDMERVRQKEREPCSRCVGASRNMSRRAGVMDVAPSYVVVEAGLRNILLWVDCHLMG